MKMFLIFICVLLITVSGCSKEPAYHEMIDLGIKYLEEGNYAEAIIKFDNAIEVENKNLEIYDIIQDVYIQHEMYYDAYELLQKAYEETKDESIIQKILNFKSEYKLPVNFGSKYVVNVSADSLQPISESINVLSQIPYDESDTSAYYTDLTHFGASLGKNTEKVVELEYETHYYIAYLVHISCQEFDYPIFSIRTEISDFEWRINISTTGITVSIDKKYDRLDLEDYVLCAKFADHSLSSVEITNIDDINQFKIQIIDILTLAKTECSKKGIDLQLIGIDEVQRFFSEL